MIPTHRSRVTSLAFAVIFAALAAPACVPVETMPLTRPAVSASGDLTVEVNVASASPAFLTQRGGDWSVLATTLVATNRSGEVAYVLEIPQATLVMSDPGGELPDVVVPITASGSGPAPSSIPLHGSHAVLGPLTIEPGGTATRWVAFRSTVPIDEPGLRRKIVVRVPVSGGGAPLDVVLAEPGVERPRWRLPPVRHASYAGVSATGNSDEGSVGVLRSSSKTVIGDAVVVAPAFEFGARAGKLRGEREPTIACCDVGLSLDITVPMLRAPWSSLGPTVGYHAIFALESGRQDKAAWHGPSAGITIFSSPIEQRVAGAFPVRTTPSVLGYSSVSLEYVHLFRSGDDGGSPAGFVTLEHSIPQW